MYTYAVNIYVLCQPKKYLVYTYAEDIFERDEKGNNTVVSDMQEMEFK